MRSLLPVLCWAALFGPGTAGDSWPDYRGPKADGHSAAIGLPITWNETTGVVWKTPIPGRAWSTPALWGSQIWMTSATADGRALFVLCVDRETGKILLDRKLFDIPSPEEIHDTNSYASPSPVLEEERVYVHFGVYGTACLDTKTFQTLWQRRDISCRHSVGPGSSPLIAGDLLLLTMDGIDVDYLIAVNKKTGATAWKTDRSVDWAHEKVSAEERKAFSTPIIAPVNGRPALISNAAKAVYAYDLRTGKEIWKVRHSGYSNSSRALERNGVAYINTGYNRIELLAIRTQGTGDITKDSILWRYGRNVPSKPSPLLIDGLLYLVHDSGVLTCLDAETGAEIWKERIPGPYSASPLYADGHIYLCSERGKITVLQPGRKFEKIAENDMSDGFMASPVAVGRALYLRSKSALYRIEKQ